MTASISKPPYHSRIWIIVATELRAMRSKQLWIVAAMYICSYGLPSRDDAGFLTCASVLSYIYVLGPACAGSTMEPLLSTGVSRWSIVAGKYLASVIAWTAIASCGECVWMVSEHLHFPSESARLGHVPYPVSVLCGMSFIAMLMPAWTFKPGPATAYTVIVFLLVCALNSFYIVQIPFVIWVICGAVCITVCLILTVRHVDSGAWFDATNNPLINRVSAPKWPAK